MRLVLTIGGLVAALAAPAAGAPVCSDTATCLQAIESAQKATRVLSARFEQTKHVSLLAAPIITRGSFAFRRPDEVVWQTGEPPVTIRITKDAVQLPEGVEREAGSQIKALTNALRQVGTLMTGSLQELTGLFEVAARPSGEDVEVHLMPRSAAMRELFSAIDMTFAGQRLALSNIRIEESLGDRLEIRFSDFHYDDAEAEAALQRR
jgi:hypothetical protein